MCGSRLQHDKAHTDFNQVLVFTITATYAPSAAAADVRSGASGDAGTSSRPSGNADEAAPPAPEGLAGSDVSKR